MKFLFVCFWVSFSLALAAFPNWKKCPASDPNANECLKEAIKGALTDLQHGGEPACYDSITIFSSSNGPFRGRLIYNDVCVDGLLLGSVKKVEKRGGGVLRAEFFFPTGKISGKYLMDTFLLALPMKGNGDFDLIFKNLTMEFDIEIKSKIINGVRCYNAESIIQPDYQIEFLQVHHSNMFGGNKAMGDNANKILNDNWKTLGKELGPITIKAFSPLYEKIMNSILNKIPVDEFPIELA